MADAVDGMAGSGFRHGREQQVMTQATPDREEGSWRGDREVSFGAESVAFFYE
jgi:hypothetical protein